MIRRTLAIVLTLLLLAGALSAGIVTGQYQTATGGTVKNGTITFTLSQSAFAPGTGSIVTQPVSCYTSNAGNIVGVPDSPAAPTVNTNTASGTLTANTYYVKVSYLAGAGEGMVSSETTVVLSATGSLLVTAPDALTASSGYAVYISSATGTETLQGTAASGAIFTQSVPLVAGASPKIANTSSCSLKFSDELIPTGTYYTVSMLNQSGTRIAGFPQSWCLYGGSGATINVSSGTPTGTCSNNGAYYPTPIMSIPPGGIGQVQSINGPLDLNGYALLNTNIGATELIANSATDIGGQVNTLIGTCTGTNCAIAIPASPTGSYPITTSMVLTSGTHVRCATRGTTLAYTGAGVAVDFNASTDASFENCTVTTNNAAAVGVKINGINNAVRDLHISGTSAKGLWATGYSGNTQSFITHVDNVLVDGYTAIGVQIDHTVDVHLNGISAFSVNNNTTAEDVVIDTGVSGVYFGDISALYGLHGLHVKHSTPGAGAYNQAPIDLKFHGKVLFDTVPGGDSCYFDSNLGTNIVRFRMLGGWCAGGGIDNTGTVITATANGVHISGGRGFEFNGEYRGNALNGFLIDDADVQDVQIQGSAITENNVSNNAAGHGVHVTQDVLNLSIQGTRIGNVLGSTGHQKYGFKVDSGVQIDHAEIAHNDMAFNDTGCLTITGATGNYNIQSNCTGDTTLTNVLWGNTSLNGPLTLTQPGDQFIMNGLNANAEIGSTTTPGAANWDFHTSGNNNDYDCRVGGSGGSATAGQGVLLLVCKGATLYGDLGVGGTIFVPVINAGSAASGGAANTSVGFSSGLTVFHTALTTAITAGTNVLLAGTCFGGNTYDGTQVVLAVANGADTAYGIDPTAFTGACGADAPGSWSIVATGTASTFSAGIKLPALTIGKAACVKADKSIGYCSTVVDAGGACTCN